MGRYTVIRITGRGNNKFDPRILQRKQDSVWETEDITVTDDRNYISEPIIRGKAVALIDGSHTGEYETSATTIEGPR